MIFNIYIYSVYDFVLSSCDKSSARKPKFPSSSPVNSYVQRWVLCRNREPNVYLFPSWVLVVRNLKMASPFPYCHVIHECQEKENPDRKKWCRVIKIQIWGLDKRLDISFSIAFGIYFITFWGDQILHLCSSFL